MNYYSLTYYNIQYYVTQNVVINYTYIFYYCTYFLGILNLISIHMKEQELRL